MNELNQLEIDQVSGGWWPLFLAAVAVYDAVSDICEGYGEAKAAAAGKKRK